MIEGQLTETRSKETERGFFLVTKTFEHSIWFECHTTLIVMNQRQEALVSRLMFIGASYQEVILTLKAWGNAYGGDFAKEAYDSFRIYFGQLTDKRSPPLLTPPSNTGLN